MKYRTLKKKGAHQLGSDFVMSLVLAKSVSFAQTGHSSRKQLLQLTMEPPKQCTAEKRANLFGRKSSCYCRACYRKLSEESSKNWPRKKLYNSAIPLLLDVWHETLICKSCWPDYKHDITRHVGKQTVTPWNQVKFSCHDVSRSKCTRALEGVVR